MKLRNALALSTLALAALAAAAPVTYRVTQNVGSLSLGQPGLTDPYLFLDFQLTDGTGTGNGNTSVRISNLGLTGGTIDYDDRRLPDLGNVTGTGSSFTLTDGPAASGDLSDRSVLFRVTSATAVLTYDFTLTAPSSADTPSPDGFNVALLYRTGTGVTDFNVVTTLAPTGNEQVNYVFDAGTTRRPLAFAVAPTFVAARVAEGDLRFGTLGVPLITPVPEPASMIVLGMGAVAFLRRRRR